MLVSRKGDAGGELSPFQSSDISVISPVSWFIFLCGQLESEDTDEVRVQFEMLVEEPETERDWGCDSDCVVVVL